MLATGRGGFANVGGFGLGGIFPSGAGTGGGVSGTELGSSSSNRYLPPSTGGYGK